MSVTNLYKTVCPECGAPTDGILPGNIFHTQLPSGQTVFAQSHEKNQARNFLVKQGALSEFVTLKWIPVAAGQRVPGRDRCEKCEAHYARIKEMQEEVEAGGVAWRCEECGKAGVVTADYVFAQQIRRESGLEAPEMCAVNYEACADHEEAGIKECKACEKVTMIYADDLCGDCYDSNEEPA